MSERRKYIRLDTVFPIEFQILRRDGKIPLPELHEGFTRNVGKGGMGIFAKTLKEYGKECFEFVPKETKVKLFINIPLDREPIESLATVEWVEKHPGAIVDTCQFGVSYDVMDEKTYKKILGYVKWLHLRPKLIFVTVILLAAATVFCLMVLFKMHKAKVETERRLAKTAVKGERAVVEKEISEKEKAEMKVALEATEKKRVDMEAAVEKLEEEKSALEETSRLTQEEKGELEYRLEELSKEKELLEEKSKTEALEVKEPEAEEKTSEIGKTEIKKVPDERIKAEVTIYDKLRELILNEKVQSLDAYVSSHPSSIYHAAALFALAELQYKHGERALVYLNYNKVVELYPKSKYAIYSSHRLEQLRNNLPYLYYSLKDFYTKYNLPGLFDYREIEPYVK